jgi:hypothetical protein
VSTHLLWNDIDRQKPKESERKLPGDTLFTTNTVWSDQGARHGLRGEEAVIKCLYYAAARVFCVFLTV